MKGSHKGASCRTVTVDSAEGPVEESPTFPLVTSMIQRPAVPPRLAYRPKPRPGTYQSATWKS